MERIASFDDFVNEEFGKFDPNISRNSAGVAIIYHNKILLVHPTGASWKKGTCGIPKGTVDDNEDIKLAAIREVREEVGISIDPDKLGDANVVTIFNRKGVPDKQLIYFTYEIFSLDEIGLTDLKVPKKQLQLDEVDWAGFVSAEEAYPITSRVQMIILDRHLKLSNK